MRERAFCKRLAEKHARSPENEAQKAIFTPQNSQNKMENKYFLLEKRQKFRNNLTDLHNIKTK